jgi:predicted flap endonuclease-1-like 5' DNA nuclease
MILAVKFGFGTWTWITWLVGVLAFLLGWFIQYFFGHKFGKSKEEVLRRVVDTSTDESTRIKTLADEHAATLKLKDDALLKARSEHEASFAGIRADHEKATLALKERDAQLVSHQAEISTHKTELATHKAEATKLQGLVGSVDTNRKELDDLRAQLAKQKGDYDLQLGDWRKRLEASEAAKVAADKKLADLDGSHKAVLVDWQNRFTAAESAKVAAEKKAVDLDAAHKVTLGQWEGRVKDAEAKHAEVQGLVGSTKADNERVLGDWRKRAETAEASVGNSSKRVGELEARIAAMEADHGKVVVDWQARVKAAEAKHAEVQGLVGSTKADNDKAVADWRGRYASLEAELNTARSWEGKYNGLVGERDAHKASAADWQTKYNGLVGERDSLKTSAGDWESKYKGLVGERDTHKASAADWQTKYNGLIGERDTHKASAADWQTKYNGLIGERDTHKAAASEWQTKHTSLVGEHTKLQGQLAEASAGPDDLLVIEGIGPKINTALRADGLTRWVHVRDAGPERLKSAIEKAGITFAPSMVTWSKQAAYLAAGDQAGFKQYTEYLISGQDPTSYGGQAVTGTDRVQALAGETVYGSGKVEVDESLKNTDGRDNLVIIEGIGPKFNEALCNAGIDSFVKVAASSEGDLRAAIELAGLKFAPSLSTWAQQADLLAKGDKAGFDALVARLVAGRDEG